MVTRRQVHRTRIDATGIAGQWRDTLLTYEYQEAWPTSSPCARSPIRPSPSRLEHVCRHRRLSRRSRRQAGADRVAAGPCHSRHRRDLRQHRLADRPQHHNAARPARHPDAGRWPTARSTARFRCRPRRRGRRDGGDRSDLQGQRACASAASNRPKPETQAPRRGRAPHGDGEASPAISSAASPASSVRCRRPRPGHADHGAVDDRDRERCQRAAPRPSALHRKSASNNVGTVAAAAEELSSSVTEISRQVARSSEIASKAVGRCRAHQRHRQALSTGAEKIGEVVKLIHSHRRADQSAGAQRHHRGGARRQNPAAALRWSLPRSRRSPTRPPKATEEISAQVAAMQASTSEARLLDRRHHRDHRADERDHRQHLRPRSTSRAMRRARSRATSSRSRPDRNEISAHIGGVTIGRGGHRHGGVRMCCRTPANSTTSPACCATRSTSSWPRSARRKLAVMPSRRRGIQYSGTSAISCRTARRTDRPLAMDDLRAAASWAQRKERLRPAPMLLDPRIRRSASPHSTSWSFTNVPSSSGVPEKAPPCRASASWALISGFSTILRISALSFATISFGILRRPEIALPRRDVEIRHASLLHRRQLRHQWRTIPGGDRERAQRLAIDVRQAGQHVDEHHGDAAADHVVERRRRALVGHVQQIDAGIVRESGAGDDRRRTSRWHRSACRIGLCVGDQVRRPSSPALPDAPPA